MCTYSELKKEIMCNLPPPLFVIKNSLNGGARYVLKLYASCGIDISKCIEGGSMKLTTLVDWIYMCTITNAFPCNECIFFKCINFF